MCVECAERGHLPHHFGQHAEGYHYPEVGLESAQLFYESRISEVGGLHHLQSMFDCILLDRTGLELAAVASNGLVRHGDDGDDVVAAFYQGT